MLQSGNSKLKELHEEIRKISKYSKGIRLYSIIITVGILVSFFSGLVLFNTIDTQTYNEKIMYSVVFIIFVIGIIAIIFPYIKMSISSLEMRKTLYILLAYVFSITGTILEISKKKQTKTNFGNAFEDFLKKNPHPPRPTWKVGNKERRKAGSDRRKGHFSYVEHERRFGERRGAILH